MQEIITLHCGIDGCNTHYEYKHDEENIVGICAQWRNEKSKGGDWAGLLPEKPNVGEKYELLINFALKLDLTQSFWVTYFDPYTEHEGLESELGINSMLFCLCRKKSVIEVGNRTAKLEIEVLDIKKITEDNVTKAETNKRTEFLDKEINSRYVSVENFEKFSVIRANYQSDWGWTYIIEKKNGKSRIAAENHWDFHQTIWQLTNEELSKEQEKKYGIQTSV
ncbi:MAG: hypothetical protein KF900_00895 [Bacteroidetes bacterium]|nr:hypothetical protein [Bacteroidota bacterium]